MRLPILGSTALFAAIAAFSIEPAFVEGNPVATVAPVSDADYYNDGRPPKAKVEPGRALFFDRILSGNRNIACATCHQWPSTAKC